MLQQWCLTQWFSNFNCLADIAHNVAQLGQAGDMENFEDQSRASCKPYQSLELPPGAAQSQDK